MALRVLLADESSTIKRVMQLALQDYAVEVRAVPVGIDVLPVAKNYKPDLIFVDVLLPKKPGYEVARELKSDSELKGIPVVLMWSGFMELDEAKAAQAQVDRRLEKPFDAEELRSLVQQLVPKTMTNPVSSYLQFPKLPEFNEEPNAAMPNAPAGHSPSPEVMLDAELPSSPGEMPMEAGGYQGPSAGGEESIYGIPEAGEGAAGEGWAHQDLSKFRIDVPSEEAPGHGGNQAFEKYMIPAEELSHAHVESSGDFEEVSFEEVPLTGGAKSAPARGGTNPGIQRAAIEAAAPVSGGSATNQVLAEKILREEARAVLEKLCWQILPEIAERVVKEEINKLLKSAEKNI